MAATEIETTMAVDEPSTSIYDLGAPIAGLLDDDDEEMPIAGPSTITSSSSGLNTPIDDSFSCLGGPSKAISDGVDMLGASLFDALEEDDVYVPSYMSQPEESPLDSLSKRLSTSPDPEPFQPTQGSLPELDDLFPAAAPPTDSCPKPSAPAYLGSISARSFSGKLVLFPRRVKLGGPDHSLSRPADTSKLLAVPIHRMLDDLSSLKAQTINQEENFPEETPIERDPPKPAPATPCDMWVDKYRPKKFTDLVGDESVHRAALAWLKEWDPCVFKRRPTKRKRVVADPDELERAPDEWGRPHEKILLLAGPPGLGKTTLAHVVAAAAGYSVLEINASDARTGNVIDERIKPALETGSGIGKSKPVLIVVDEVDGATGENNASFVTKLVQLTIDGRRKRPKAGEKRNPKDKRPLLRPIICICNDLWATSITKLRAVARIVKFTPPGPAPLIKRLREICDAETLKADTRALTLLATIAKADFRGCLNTLQMIHTRRQTATEHVIRCATAGMKESETTIQAVWNDIFLPLSKKRVKELALSDVEKSKYVDRLARLVESSGTMDKVMLGCFSHYAHLHHQDPSWKRYLDANRWLCTFDLFSSTMRTEQEYVVLQYMPYLVVPMHPLFVDGGNTKVGNPKADWECYVKAKECEEIYKSLQSSVVADHGRRSASLRHLLSNKVVVEEFAPILNRIMSPPLRPVNSQVIRPEERAMLKKLVDVMVTLELRFVHEKADDGQLVYRLDPPIDVFVTYDGKRAIDIVAPRYAVRHMIAAEIEAEYAARHEDAVEKNQGKKASSFFGKKKLPPVHPEDEGENHPPQDGHEDERITQLKPDAVDMSVPVRKEEVVPKVDIADKPPVDFFGRLIKRKEPENDANGSRPTGPPAKKFKVRYQFNEGASAAVRRPIIVQSLL